ncbi:TrmB family transcriptional regulator [Candidatus Woesearchaeota archaeon]|nr:TrmB family transcriptional regulator [Candidatus Woesearchaeota archaeon]
MYENLLSSLGLTQNEVKVYLSLLKQGKAKSGTIITSAGISSGKIYATLAKLVSKGLVEVSSENGVKVFHATDPESLLLYLQEKEKELSQEREKLQNIIPELKKLHLFAAPEEGVFMIKGFRGIKPIVDEVLQKSTDEFKIMGVRSSKKKNFNTFWMHWHKERARLGKKAKILFVDKNTSYWDFFQKLKHTQTRILSSITPSAFMIVGNHSFLFSYEEEFSCAHIISRPIAHSLSSFFDDLWKNAKE